MEVLLAIALVAALAAFVAVPLRRAGGVEDGEDAAVADLEARKEAVYRQIRDAELDHEQGKLSDADFKRLDAELRREAIAVLKRLDATEGRRAENAPAGARTL